jgi:hypothetical protein
MLFALISWRRTAFLTHADHAARRFLNRIDNPARHTVRSVADSRGRLAGLIS